MSAGCFQGILLAVTTPPSPRIPDESACLDPAAMRDENRRLRETLALSERARADLLAQAEHLLEVIAWSRREIRDLQAKVDAQSRAH
jgi:hypothetical protein